MQAQLKRTAVTALVTLGAAALFAGTTHKPKTPPLMVSAPAPVTSPTLTLPPNTKVLSGSMNIVDGDLSSTDSPLVRAAKKANLARAQYARQGFTSVVLDDTMLAGSTKGTVFESTGPAGSAQEYSQRYADATARPEAPPLPAAPSAADAAAEAAKKQKVAALKQEYARMAEQADEVYPTDVSEDQVDKRLHDIPNEIKNLQSTPAVPVNPPPQ